VGGLRFAGRDEGLFSGRVGIGFKKISPTGLGQEN